MPSYPVKAWDGTEWVEIAAQPTDLTNYATLASPSFTGTPLAPTASTGTNTTQIATTEYVTTAVEKYVISPFLLGGM